MATPFTVPLYDPKATPSSWNERMQEGDYAVHFSAFHAQKTSPYCSIFPSLPAAEAFAKEQVLKHPEMRCTIYSSDGFVGAPIRDVRGVDFKDKSEMSSRFRRWVGGLLFVGGIVLTGVDWAADFRYLWPSMLGTRMIIPGLLLLCIEAAVMYNTHRKQAQDQDQDQTQTSE